MPSSTPTEPIAPPDPASSLPPALLPPSIYLRVMNIAVVSPDPSVGARVTQELTAGGHQAHPCPPEAALTLLESEPPPDVVLWHLNHFTAAAAADFLDLRQRQSTRDGAVVAFTDHEQPVSRVEAWLKRGMDDFLVLPIPPHGPGALATRIAVVEHGLRQRRERAYLETHAIHAVQKYQEVFQSAPEAALIVSAGDGLILEANPAAAQILGIARDTLVDRYLSLVLPGLFDQNAYDPRNLGLGATLRLPEISHQRPDQLPCWLDVHVTLVPWPPSEALLIKLHDITWLKHQESRRLHEARLDAAGRVMAGTSRELGDALTAIRGNLELLLRQPPSQAEIRELTGQAREACDRAAGLSRRLNVLARTARGAELRKRTVDLKPFLERTIPFALLSGTARPVLHLDKDLWPVEADEAALTELIRHLVENADLAMPTGGILTIEAQNIRPSRSRESREAWVRLRFQDHGHGIDPAHLPMLFDPWFTTRPGRDGMGLAMAAALAKAHHGHLSAESTQGQGATFTLWLPVPLPRALHESVSSPAAPSTDGTGPVPLFLAFSPPESKGRILFMDDDPGIRAVVQRILTTAGYEVFLTSDGHQAIDAYRRAREFGAAFDLIIVDLDVRGGMGGIECTARLQAEFPALKALLTSGAPDEELMENYRSHGFLGVIPKPFQIDRLLHCLSRLLVQV